MIIKLNGKEKKITENTTILSLLEELKLNPQKVAVELNRTIIKKEKFDSQELQDGDEIEVLQFVGGGSCDQ